MKRKLVSSIIAAATSMILLVPLGACDDDPNGFQGIPPLLLLEAGLFDVNLSRLDATLPPGRREAGSEVFVPKAEAGADAAPPTCGNGAVDPGETCDTNGKDAGACPTSCAPLGCQLRALEKAGTCEAACANTTTVTECVSGDGCCPAGCNATNDNECTPGCGNGVVENGETCDTTGTGAAACPTACPTTFACELRTLQGTGCQVACASAGMETACKNGDGCCAPGCNATNDSDCPVVCGNGVVEAGETCDTAIVTGPGACPTSCTTAGCNVATLTGSACQAQCVGSTITTCANNDLCCPTGCNTTSANLDNDCAAVCGNGQVERGETCDPLESCLACPAASPPKRYSCYGTGVGTCAQNCDAPILTCGPSADGCCPFGAAGACGSGADSDCKNTSGWQFVQVGSVDTTAGCQNIYLNAERGGSYDLTTCGPSKDLVGSGNPNITQVLAAGSGMSPIVRGSTNLQAHNDDCTDPNALPKLAGWYCANALGDANVQACASPSPGGFISPSTLLGMTVCAGADTIDPTCPVVDKSCIHRGDGVTPLYLWYNASVAPSACVATSSACGKSGALGCCAGDSCVDATGVPCTGAGCTCQATTTCVANGASCSSGGFGCCTGNSCLNPNFGPCNGAPDCTCKSNIN